MINLLSGSLLACLFIISSGFRMNSVQDSDRTAFSGILKENMKPSVQPGDNFFEFVNGKWIDETEIPADKASFGIFLQLAEKSQDDVKAIIEASAAAGQATSADEQKVGALYASYMDRERREALGYSPLADGLAKIDGLKQHEDLPAYFAYAIRTGYGKPFSVFVNADFKNPDRYALYAWQSGLGLPDREYYLAEDESSQEIRKKYLAQIGKIMNLAGVETSDQTARDILALETRMAQQHMKKEDLRDRNALYNPHTIEELEELLPGFGWQAFLEEAGVQDINRLIVGQVEYLRSLDGIIRETGMDTWKAYLKWRMIDTMSTYLTAEMDAQNFAFYGTTLSGTPEQQAMWRRGVSVVSGTLGEVVGKVYVEKHFPPAAKERMQVLVGHLLKAYETSIRSLDWMGEATRVEALDKLSKITTKIGYPDQWKDYSELEIRADDLFGNMLRARAFAYARQIDKLGGPIQRHEWGMTPQTVNAYYNGSLNEIVFPAAILQPPFFNLAVDDAVNYGAIGAIIGHEIGHGFDDKGSTFDGNGALRNWWTDEDRAEFERRTQKLVAQYDSYAVLDDLHVNGTFTLGENIGDLGGLSIALKAYQMSLGDTPTPSLDGFTGIQRVFIGYGQAWRVKYREAQLRRMILTDPHSPGPFRCNGVVRNIPEFYEAFDVKPGDALYLAPEDRVKIW